LLEESHYLDLKRELGSTRSANKELARDLASFAIDGGTLLVGVAEGDDGALHVAPVELEGLPERIEQIARTAIDPPLALSSNVLRDQDNPSRGCVVVSIPPSGTAPHMVDGVYQGRGDKTKTRLSDAEVTRLHASRVDVMTTAAQLVAEYSLRDPVPETMRQQAHIFIVAAPVAPRREMLVDALDGDDAIRGLIQAGADLESLEEVTQFSPDLRDAHTVHRRLDGVALACGLTDARELLERGHGRFNEDVFEVELSDDGVIRMMTTRFSDVDRSGEQVFFEEMLPVLVRRVVGIAAAVAGRTGYLGQWMIGLAVTGVAGMGPYLNGGHNYGRRFGVDQPEYRRETVASSLELTEGPGAVTERIVGRYARMFALAGDHRFVRLFG